MLLEEKWKDNLTGTTDNGEGEVLFFVSGVTKEDKRQLTLRRLKRSRKDRLTQVKLTYEATEEDSTAVKVELIIPSIWKRPRHIGWVPRKISDAISRAICIEGMVSNIEIAELSDTMFGREDTYSCRLRLNYMVGSRIPIHTLNPDGTVPDWHISLADWVPGNAIEIKLEDVILPDDLDPFEADECAGEVVFEEPSEVDTWMEITDSV